MKTATIYRLALLIGALSLFGCKSGDGGEGEEAHGAAEGSVAAEGEASEGEAAEGEAAEGEAAEGEAAAEGLAAAAEGEAAPAGDFAATADALVGSWDADFQAMLAAQEMTDEERAMAQAFFGSAQMTLTFAADGSLTSAANMMGQEQTEAGTYSVATNEGNTLSVSTTVTKEGSEPEVETVTVTFASADSITISDEGGEAIPFNRKAE